MSAFLHGIVAATCAAIWLCCIFTAPMAIATLAKIADELTIIEGKIK